MNVFMPVVAQMRSVMGMRVLYYIEDFLVRPTNGGMRREEDIFRACDRLGDLLEHLRIARNEGKGVWS